MAASHRNGPNALNGGVTFILKREIMFGPGPLRARTRTKMHGYVCENRLESHLLLCSLTGRMCAYAVTGRGLGHMVKISSADEHGLLQTRHHHRDRCQNC